MGNSCLQAGLVLWVVICLSLSGIVASETMNLSRCKKHELQALLKFKHSFIKDHMNRLSSWVGEDCCQWRGVGCDDVTGSVIKLNLRAHPLYYESGFIDCESKSKISLSSSEIDSALLELEHLSHLDLSWNDFNGSRIPEFIGSMKHLKYLNLSKAGLNGSIPHHIGNLTNLIHLDLSLDSECDYLDFNELSARSVGWASRLSKLQSLYMDGRNLSLATDTIHSLSNFPSLSKLSLVSTSIGNTHFSYSFVVNSTNTFFPALEYLDLSHNELGGPIPSILGNVTSLISLSMVSNHLNGSVPLWLHNLKKLEFLDLRDNALSNVETGIWGIMGNPCNFKYLDLSHNYLEGELLKPLMNFSTCAAYDLEYLNLGGNNINGSVPPLLGQLKKLKHLDLSYNHFEGQIPKSLTEIIGLEYLDFSQNRLEGFIPSIANLSELSVLDTSGNNVCVNLTLDRPPRFQLESLGIGSCEMSGVFPQWLRNQTQLKFLDLSNNNISGKVPNWIWNMTSLQFLHLSNNHLTGSVTNIPFKLFTLSLFDNLLTGPLPQHVGGSELVFLDLHNNMLSGPIPGWLCNLRQINFIELSTNLLSGTFLEGQNTSLLFTNTNLLILDLSGNKLSGQIRFPYVSNSSSYMEFLNLRGNSLSGPIPLGFCSLALLHFIDLAHNHFTNHIPSCFEFLTFISSPIGFNTTIIVTEFIKRQRLEYSGSSSSASDIDLSCNHLVGTIAEGLTNLSGLSGLNLSYNHLTGSIPKAIGNMGQLESLDLSNNRLTGTIPQSLSTIKWLEVLNLSNNDLHGPIPTGQQLQTFDDPSIYTGNPGLCGFPLPNKCTKPISPPSMESEGEGDDEEEDKRDKLWMYLAIMLGVATGFWGVVLTLVLKKNWRHAYFRLVEEIMDKIYVLVMVRVNRFKRKSEEANSG